MNQIEILKKAIDKISEAGVDREIESAISEYVEKEFALHEKLKEDLLLMLSNVKISVPAPVVNIPPVKAPQVKVDMNKVEKLLSEIMKELNEPCHVKLKLK